MISSPCSAEQAQRIKLCPRKSPPQSFPPTAQQAPGHFVRGLCCSRAAQPAAEAASGQGPPRMRSIQKALGQPSGGSPALHPKPAAQQVTHSRRGARGGKARLWSDPYRKPSDISSGGLPMRFIQNPPRGRSRTAAGELEGARPASNEIDAESPRTFRPGAFCILFFSCCAFSARSPASAAGSGSRRSWR